MENKKPQRPVVRGRSIDTTMREAQKNEVRPEEGLRVWGERKKHGQTQVIRKTDQRLE